MSIDGPAITGTDRDTGISPLNYQYLVASEPQISGGFGSSQTETLTDVLHYYWSSRSAPRSQKLDQGHTA